MEMERERGISITTSVLQFPYRGMQMNLLDTPGHADFSEDTYRTLHAVDGAVMLLDSAKGVESQTRKLFRVCRQRAIPIFTFVNKMDRPGREPFELIGEVESVLGIGVYPITWPVFRGGTFAACTTASRGACTCSTRRTPGPPRAWARSGRRSRSPASTIPPSARRSTRPATRGSARTRSCSRRRATTSIARASRRASCRPCSSGAR